MTDERGHEVASFHLARFPIHAAPGELGAMWFGRGALAAVEGLRWWKPLILGLGPPRRPHHYPLPSLRRGALLARWEDERALDEFLAGSEVAERWRRRSRELWHVCLEPVTSRGGWQGLSPPFPVARPHPLPDGPAVLLTYGRLWARAVVPFFRTLSSVHADLRTRDRLLAYTGSVEAGRPFVTVISFSLWTSLPPALNFALAGAAHTRAIDRSRVERWFRETAFTRFRPYRSEGTWNGTDPLRLARAWAAAHATPSSS